MLKEQGQREGYLLRSQLAGLWCVVSFPIGVRDEAAAKTGCGAFSA